MPRHAAPLDEPVLLPPAAGSTSRSCAHRVQVIEGMDVVDRIRAVGSASGKTAAKVLIADSGVLRPAASTPAPPPQPGSAPTASAVAVAPPEPVPAPTPADGSTAASPSPTPAKPVRDCSTLGYLDKKKLRAGVARAAGAVADHRSAGVRPAHGGFGGQVRACVAGRVPGALQAECRAGLCLVSFSTRRRDLCT